MMILVLFVLFLAFDIALICGACYAKVPRWPRSGRSSVWAAPAKWLTMSERSVSSGRRRATRPSTSRLTSEDKDLLYINLAFVFLLLFIITVIAASCVEKMKRAAAAVPEMVRMWEEMKEENERAI
jgi:hypothetical protein